MKIKICGITNLNDALAAAEYGADTLGFILQSKSPRYIKPDKVKSIISALPSSIITAGVFVDSSYNRIREIMSIAGLDIIQLHGTESPDFCSRFDRVFKAIRIKTEKDTESLSKYEVMAYLLDTYSPDMAGGTGQVFNWEIAIKAKKMGNIILAGGLNPDNIEQAIKFVQPYGVDVSTGVEGSEKGKKDLKKLKQFIDNARAASNQKR